MSCPFGFTGGIPDPQKVAPAAMEGEEDGNQVHYHSYLQLDKILNAQTPLSNATESPAHCEMLFIITHQTYELWFKQIIHELDSVINIFAQGVMEEEFLLDISSRLSRITEIQRVLIDQIRILETMTPMEFLEFRNLLTPASGFQSLQFRVIENKLGMIHKNRVNYQQKEYTKHFTKQEHREQLENSQNENCLFLLIDEWLSRTPFVNDNADSYQFWNDYQAAVMKMLEEERKLVLEADVAVTREEQDKNYANVLGAFEDMFNEEKYEEHRKQGKHRLSYKACQAALFIYVYREQPALQLPHRILDTLTEIDTNMVTWRFRHVMMVQRMIGLRIGTGGSKGYQYLRSTVSDRYKVFLDLTTLSTFIIPRCHLPKLPEETKKRLGFFFANTI